MREYSKVSPKFWIGETGRTIKTKGMEAIIVASYLMTSPHSNMLGLFYQSEAAMAHETGLGLEGARKGLNSCIEAGFCLYDTRSEVVWVIEMAAYQIEGRLDEKDNRCKGIQKEYEALIENPFLSVFYDRYAECFHMTAKRIPKRKIEAPPKPLRSQEQEQEQEHEKEHEQEQNICDGASPPSPPQKAVAVAKQKPAKDPAPTNGIWEAYAGAYENRYGVEPVRNGKVNGQLTHLLTRLGADEAPLVAAWFVGHNDQWYVKNMHSVDYLLRDAEKLRTEWATGTAMTTTRARQADRTSSMLSIVDEIRRERGEA